MEPEVKNWFLGSGEGDGGFEGELNNDASVGEKDGGDGGEEVVVAD